MGNENPETTRREQDQQTQNPLKQQPGQQNRQGGAGKELGDTRRDDENGAPKTGATGTGGPGGTGGSAL